MVFDVPRDQKLDGTMGQNTRPGMSVEVALENVFNDESLLGGHSKRVIRSDAEEFTSSVKPREEEKAMCHLDWRDNMQVL